jgi:hypothetical protein
VAQRYPQALVSSGTSGGATPRTHYCGPLRVLDWLTEDSSYISSGPDSKGNTAAPIVASAIVVSEQAAMKTQFFHC